MKINKELFVIPEGKGSYILYTPLQGHVMKVNSGVIGTLQVIQKGRSIDGLDFKIIRDLFRKNVLVIDSFVQRLFHKTAFIKYAPTGVTLMPSFDCNLRCVYCYSEGGENPGEDMTWDIAKSAIDFVVDNCRENPFRNKKAHLGFHGGGEPLLEKNKPLINRSVDYFRKECAKYSLDASVSSATNGLLSKRNLEWAVETFDHLNISLDGMEDIQNAQRPKPLGRPSFKNVMGTIHFLEDKKYKYGIRSTITRESVSQMPEIVEFFHGISPSLKSFHLEPLHECGRCKTTSTRAPSPIKFLKYSLKAREVGEKFGISLAYSGAKLGNIHDTFCGAAGRNFFVTPQGYATTCLEVCRDTDSRKDIFIIGKYDSEKNKFVFDNRKIETLKNRIVENIPHCEDCFAKYNCSGDCLAKIYGDTGDLHNTRKNPRCSINRGLLYDEIQKKLNTSYD